MPLSETAATERVKELLEYRQAERGRLERIRDYLRNDPDWRPSWLPSSAPSEVHQLARISRVRLLPFVVNARSHAMYVDGFRTPRSADDVPAWDVWQRNRFDARQIGVHRSALAYGAAYATVLPGEPVPVMRGASARHMTALYGDDDDWPRFALEKRKSGWRLFDEEAVYVFDGAADGEALRFLGYKLHGAQMDGEAVCPVVRYRDTDDLDDPVSGIVEPLMDLQDQIDVTTFALLVAQQYGAFRQRYILGWATESEEEKLKASAAKLWTFEDPDVKVGEFNQTDLKGYIDSREATLRHLATVSATPAHELLGQLANLSAEALAAAEAGYRRAVTENQTVLGESHEQALNLVASYMNMAPDPSASVRWRDTESRSLAQTVDALGKLTQMLGVPPQELWERVPGVTDPELERWKAAAAQGDAFANLTAVLERQATPEREPETGTPEAA
ncbi:phage portal protein [Actinomadura sp. NPDC049382]|uniref:phage portal protein n=1 Tax=Actinomadura sp. NPDC049382 TaxID=3158220 RepID=UPI003417F298